MRQRLAERAALEAARFDGLFESIAQVAESTAAHLSTGELPDERRLYELARANLLQSPLVYGSCIAFEPGAFDPKRRLFAPYVFRGSSAPTPSADGPPPPFEALDVGKSYDYTEPRWEWYEAPSRSLRSGWTEPFFDKGAGDVAMCTFTAPIVRDGKFAGVATVDVRLSDLPFLMRAAGRRHAPTGAAQATDAQDEPGALAEARFGDTQFGIVSRLGRFVVHPDPAYVMKETIDTVSRRLDAPTLQELGGRMTAGRRGVSMIPSGQTDRGIMVAYAPIPSTGWSYADSVSEEEIMAPVLHQLNRRALFLAGTLVVVVGLVYVAASIITRPISRLAAGVRELAAGNLEARAESIDAGDEVGDLARAFNTMVKELKARVDELTRETARREQVESELRVGRLIQASLLPRRFPPFPDRKELDLHATLAPARYVAGDFFDFFFVDDRRLLIVIGDVSGKGVPAAMFMAVTRTILRDLARSTLSPGELLTRANGALLESNDEGLFVTVFLGIYDVATGELRYANAGHPPPSRVRAGTMPEPMGEVTGTVLGVLDHQTYEERVAQLAPGDSIVLYTDGVTEARSPEGSALGNDAFRAMLIAHSGDTPKGLCDHIVAEVGAFQAGDPADDITLLVLRRNG